MDTRGLEVREMNSQDGIGGTISGGSNTISGGSDLGSNPNSVHYQLGDFEQAI